MYQAHPGTSYMFLPPLAPFMRAFASGCTGIHELPLSHIEAWQVHTRVADEAQVQVGWDQKLLACARMGLECLAQYYPSMGWIQGKSTGNHRCSHEIWDVPVFFPLNQSIDRKENYTKKIWHVGHQNREVKQLSNKKEGWCNFNHPAKETIGHGNKDTWVSVKIQGLRYYQYPESRWKCGAPADRHLSWSMIHVIFQDS